jgi:serine/threonine protein kinase
MSYVQGRPARRAVGELPDSRAFVRALEGTVRQMHRRGVVHLDLKHRSNLLVTEQGDPLVLDFESAVRFNPRSLVGRAAVALLGQFDWLAVANWKRRLCPQMLRASPGARRRARLARRLRGAWLPRRIIDVFVDLLVRPRWRGGPGSS